MTQLPEYFCFIQVTSTTCIIDSTQCLSSRVSQRKLPSIHLYLLHLTSHGQIVSTAGVHGAGGAPTTIHLCSINNNATSCLTHYWITIKGSCHSLIYCVLFSSQSMNRSRFTQLKQSRLKHWALKWFKCLVDSFSVLCVYLHNSDYDTHSK